MGLKRILKKVLGSQDRELPPKNSRWESNLERILKKHHAGKKTSEIIRRYFSAKDRDKIPERWPYSPDEHLEKYLRDDSFLENMVEIFAQKEETIEKEEEIFPDGYIVPTFIQVSAKNQLLLEQLSPDLNKKILNALYETIETKIKEVGVFIDTEEGRFEILPSVIDSEVMDLVRTYQSKPEQLKLFLQLSGDNRAKLYRDIKDLSSNPLGQQMTEKIFDYALRTTDIEGMAILADIFKTGEGHFTGQNLDLSVKLLEELTKCIIYKAERPHIWQSPTVLNWTKIMNERKYYQDAITARDIWVEKLINCYKAHLQGKKIKFPFDEIVELVSGEFLKGYQKYPHKDQSFFFHSKDIENVFTLFGREEFTRLDAESAAIVIKKVKKRLDRNNRDFEYHQNDIPLEIQWENIEKMAKKLVEFDSLLKLRLDASKRTDFLEYLGETIINYQYSHLTKFKENPNLEISVTKGFWKEIDELIGVYKSWMELQQSDKSGLAEVLLEEIAFQANLPIFREERRESQISREVLEKHIFVKAIPTETSFLDRIGSLKKVIGLYKQYFECVTEFDFPVQEIASIAKDCSMEELERIFELIKLRQCRTLEEVTECAELNKKLENTGYKVVKKIGPGTFKEVYLAKDHFGREGALKRIDSEAESVIREKGLNLQEMLSKDLTVNPFDLKHPNVCSTVPIYTTDETFILEELYEMTLEDLLRMMHSSGKFAAHTVHIGTPEIERDALRPLYQLSSNAPLASPEYLESLSKMKNGPENYTTAILFPFSELILGFITQLVNGVQACHQQKIVHADLKTNNLGIKKDLTLVLSDFGMATLDEGIRARKDPSSIYIRDIKLLKPGSRPDWQSDYWAIGAVLYRLCTGRFPFSKEPVTFTPEEREEYIQAMHTAYSKGDWKEQLQENIINYLPHGFEIGNFVLDEGGKNILGKEVFLEPNQEIMEKIKTFLQMCFRLSGEEIAFSSSFMESNLSGINSELDNLKMRRWRYAVKVSSLDKVRKYFEEAGKTEIIQKDFPFKYRILCTTKEVYQD